MKEKETKNKREVVKKRIYQEGVKVAAISIKGMARMMMMRSE